MNNLDKRLREDAAKIKVVPANEMTRDALMRRVHETPQRPQQQDRDTRVQPVWLWGLSAVAAAMVVAFVLIPIPSTTEDTVPTMVTPAKAGPSASSGLERPELSQVSYEQALIDEWQYIQNDLSLTREKIEADLSVQF